MDSVVTQQTLVKYVEDRNYEAIHTQNFYRKIFPEGCLGTLDGTDGKPLGILVFKDAKGKGLSHVAIANDLEALTSQVGQPYVVLAPIAYFGKRISGGHASFLRALTIDIELTSVDELDRVLKLVAESVVLKATFFAVTGNHIQLYYIYEEGQELSIAVQKDILEQKAYLVSKFNEFLQLAKPIKVTPLAQTLPMVGSLQGVQQEEVKAYKLNF